MMNAQIRIHVAAVLAALAAVSAHADTVSEDFTGTTTNNPWYFFNGACLTASSAAPGSSPGQIPGCTAIRDSYYNENLVGGANGKSGSQQTLPDPVGSGALRFTNGYLTSSTGGYNQSGAIVSSNTFPTGQGVQITFKTVTYRGNSGGDGGDGADGISFFLMDGNEEAGIGAFGGSLGYSCSNTNAPYNGLVGGYLGLGVDEFGNFLNGAKLMPGYSGNSVKGDNGDNAALGYGYKPNRIGLRGAGSISWEWLHSKYPQYYPLSKLNTAERRQAATQTACITGSLWDYSDSYSHPTKVTSTSIYDYKPIPNAYKELPSNVLIAKEYAKEGYKRGDATPIVYDLKITQDGLLSFAYSINGAAWQSVISKQSIRASNGPLPDSFRFGFAGSTGGSTNIHEILCFKAQPLDLSASSVGVNEKQSAKVENGTQAYFAFYDPNDWSGRLTANDLFVDDTNTLVVASAANWDASCGLTGVASGKTCPTTGAEGAIAAQGSTARTILTWSGSAGIPFQWANLTTAQKAALTQGDSTQTSDRLDYLRGVRTKEVDASGTGLFRARNSVLGDIVDSSPTWVGPPAFPYTAAWKDRLYPSPETPPAETATTAQTYTQFINSKQTRANVVYVGANDGLLHGFRSGAFDANGNYTTATTPNDGRELLAYMPGAVLNTIHNSSDASVDFPSTQYGHNYFVDANPGTGDLFYADKWHTWVVGGLGPGGAAIYALDVTDPSTFSEANASSLVIGEWTPSSLTCENVSDCGKNLGKTYGVPLIRRMHNGQWAVIFGNGFESSTGDAGIYIMLVNPTDGARSFYYLSTGKAGSNGIAYVSSADLDGDHVTDYVYAGDLLGNIWRFDVTSDDADSWAAGEVPLFTAPSGQPITTRLVVASGPSALGPQQLMIAFGTGQKTPFTNTEPVSYKSGTQSLYGIWDWNMAAWNAKSGAQYASLADTATGLSPNTVKKTNLQKQTFTVNGAGNRDITANAVVCWKGSTACATPTDNTKFGWYADLPGSGEQIVFNPQLLGSAFVVNSVVPASNSILSCTTNTDTGYTYAISVMNGGAFNNFFPQYNDTIAAGVKTDATGTSFPVMTPDGETYLVYQTVRNSHQTKKVNLPKNIKADRLTWIELR